MIKIIDGFENYGVDELGDVYNIADGKKMKPIKNKDGYLQIGLSKSGKKKMFLVHRLVAQAFIPNSGNRPQVNHKDENKVNNRVDNLEWCDSKYNCNYGTGHKRSAESQINIPSRSKPVLCVELGVIFPSISEAGRKTGLPIGNITAACKGRYKTIGGFHWEYA